MKNKNEPGSNKLTTWLHTLVRLLIGWHFLYEGISKIVAADWSSAPYLAGSRWIFAPLFNAMAENATVVGIIDQINIWGMVLIGLGLILGLLSRWAALGGTLMLLFYFVAYPPIPGYMFGLPAEGDYLWVNRNLIELFALSVFIFISPVSHYGLDRLISRWRSEKARVPVGDYSSGSAKGIGRRDALRDLISIPVFGAFAYALYRKRKWDSFEERLLAIEGMDANSGATLLKFNYSTLKDLKGVVPKGFIKYRDDNGNQVEFELSRLIMGGNLIGGWAHARDLIYVSKLVKTYHTDEKVLQTLALGEKCGMNAIISNPQMGRIFQKYRREFKGKMKFISDCGTNLDFQEGIRMSLAADWDALYCQGEITDRFTNPEWNDPKKRTVEERMELIKAGIDEIRANGKPAGIGAHRIEAIKACVDYGIKPDFWVKTCHDYNYWSAQTSQNWNDNIFDFDPEETVSYMGTIKEPWIAFKVLAAGAIKPEVGLSYAFRNGADFVCLGMYDFQIVEDVNIALEVLESTKIRERPWMA